MKLKKLANYNQRYHLGGYITTGLGGPYGQCYRAIKPGEDELNLLSKEIEYVAIRPFTSLNLDEPSSWKIADRLVESFSGKWAPRYMEHQCVIPHFVGTGHIFILVGDHEFGRIGSTMRMSAYFTAIDTKTSIKELLRILKGKYTQLGEYGTTIGGVGVRDWRLRFIIKRSWKAQNPRVSSCEIFEPPTAWLQENASFATEYASSK